MSIHYKQNIFRLNMNIKINKNNKISIRPETKEMKSKPLLRTKIKSKKLDNFGCYAAEPLIFSKKQKKDVKVIPLKLKTDTSQTRHFTPAAQEWINSIYAYNQNYTKLLPVADNNLMSLVKSYFNFFFKQNKTHKRFKGGHRITIRKRSRSKGLSANKIYVYR